MSVVALVELLAWAISALLAGWMVVDLVRVRRHHGEAALIDSADTLDEPGPGAS